MPTVEKYSLQIAGYFMDLDAQGKKQNRRMIHLLRSLRNSEVSVLGFECDVVHLRYVTHKFEVIRVN